MKELKIILFSVLFAAGLGFFGGIYYKNETHVQIRDMDTINAFFSPKGGCTGAVVEAVNTAQTTLLVQAYSFTSEPIEQALIAAQKRGVKVQVILDKSQYDAKGATAKGLLDAGIEVRMDNKHQIAHNKVMVIDNAILLTGSFNFTRQAEISNAENLLVIHNANLAALYAANWKVHYDHSDPYHGETARPTK